MLNNNLWEEIMALVQRPGLRPVNMGDLSVVTERRDDGSILVRPRDPLGPYPRTIIDRLDEWAARTPDAVLFADRGADGAWRRLTYAEATRQSFSIGQALLERGLSAERPFVILSGNSLEHAMLALGAQRAGVPFAPLSPAYSLVSRDFAKLRYIVDLLTPGLVYASDTPAFDAALNSIRRDGLEVVTAAGDAGTTALAELSDCQPGRQVARAFADIDGDTIAKFLFTSGSTGSPKAVINTHRMIACNQVMIAHALAFLKDKPPVLVDWLPWNHTAGGNHNFGIAIHNGGTLYIDDGSPTPAGIARTVRNLEEVAPTLYFNVPKGYEMLVGHLSRNDRLRENFFSRLELMQYAGAGLAQHVWDALEREAERTLGARVMMITGYGSTETAPFAFTTTWPVDRPGEVGLPAPGLETKLVPEGSKLELRLRGPNVTPGYWRAPEKTAEAFDAEGFYMIGDALKFVDADDPGRGFLFDGRVAEDFKLSTGTWVNFAAVRAAVVRACAPLVRDAVLTGLDRDHIGALLFLDPDAARRHCNAPTDIRDAEIAGLPSLHQEIGQRLGALAAQATGSSNLVARALVLAEPPSLDAGEVTDKGSINQRAVLAARPEAVEQLYLDPAPAGVIVARKSPA